MKLLCSLLALHTQAFPDHGLSGRRYDQFESMARMYDRRFDKRVITKYGCNCPHIGDRPLSDPGKGTPVDELDRVCLTFKQCTKCAKQRFGEDCISEFKRYVYAEDRNGFSRQATCLDEVGSCNRALCECDKMFAEMLSMVDKKSVNTAKYGFESEFVANEECKWDGNSAPLQCCWNGQSPYRLYNPDYRQCCDDGSLKPFFQPCAASVY